MECVLLAWIGGVVWIVLGFCWIVLVVLVLVGGVSGLWCGLLLNLQVSKREVFG